MSSIVLFQWFPNCRYLPKKDITTFKRGNCIGWVDISDPGHIYCRPDIANTATVLLCGHCGHLCCFADIVCTEGQSLGSEEIVDICTVVLKYRCPYYRPECSQ